MYHRRINLRRRLNCRVIQRVVRGYLARKLASRLRHERKLARLRLLAEKERRLGTVSTTGEEARQMEEDAATKRADIRVTLSMMLYSTCSSGACRSGALGSSEQHHNVQ